MATPIVLPELGAGRVTLSVWYADRGDPVLEGERLVEVLADGATFEVVSPATGRLKEKRVYPNEAIKVGQVLGIVE